MRRLAPLIVSACALTGLVGCGGDGTPAPPDSGLGTTDNTGLLGVSEPLDDSPFCVAIRELEALSAGTAPADASVDDVLAQNAKLAALIAAASADVPDEAPGAVETLLADYGALATAIEKANGDTVAVFAALDASDPQLADRLRLPDAYNSAVVFFSERCGTAQRG